MAGMPFKETDKIGNIFIAEVIGDVFYLVGSGKQISFCFEYDLFVDEC